MALKFITAEEAASFVHHDDNVGFSGFTPAGCPKVVPGAIAKKAIAEHEKGNPFQIGMFTGASTGDKLDGELARANAIKFRTPYQSNKDLRALLNSHGAQYFDMHLSELAQSLRYGFLGKIDVAIVEAADVTEDGEIVPTSGVGILPTICRMADRIIIELNCRHPKEIRGMHDIYEPADPPYRREIPIYTPSDRIGSDCVKVDPAKIVGVVKTDEPNEGGKFSPLDDVTMAIGQNVANFLVGEIKAGRLPKEFVPATEWRRQCCQCRFGLHGRKQGYSGIQRLYGSYPGCRYCFDERGTRQVCQRLFTVCQQRSDPRHLRELGFLQR